MDKEISKEVIKRNKNKRWIYIAFAAATLIAAIVAMRGALGNTISRAKIRVAVAKLGDIENTLNATGEVQPELEQIIASPISAVVQQVYFTTGAHIKTGDKILDLDKIVTQMEYEKQQDELELKRNGIIKIKLDLDKSFYDLKIQDSIKAYQIISLKAALENARRLYKAGGGTRESIDQAETNLQVAQLEKRQLENDIRTRQAIMQTSIRETEISASIQEKGLREMEHKLQQAEIVSNRAGVLTFVNTSIGAKVSEGEIIARIADLSSFKVLGAISDSYAEQLQTGMPVIILINDTRVRGTIVNIRPSVTNNVLSFDVAFDEKSINNLLRPKMRVEIHPITALHKNTIIVANGPAFRGTPEQDVFILRNDGIAERRTVKIGLSSFDFVEITDGIKEGESVIISDMSAFRNTPRIRVTH